MSVARGRMSTYWPAGCRPTDMLGWMWAMSRACCARCKLWSAPLHSSVIGVSCRGIVTELNPVRPPWERGTKRLRGAWGLGLQELRVLRMRRLRYPPCGKPWCDHPSSDPSGHDLHEIELPASGDGSLPGMSKFLKLRFGLGLPGGRAPGLFVAWQDVDCAECFVEVLGCHI